MGRKKFISIDRNELFYGRIVGKFEAKKKPEPNLGGWGFELTRKCMQNCTQTDRVGQGFWLHFRAEGDGLEIADYDLPTPNYYHRTNEATYTVAWLLNGYFGTIKGRAYLNDMIGRLSLGMKIANRLPYAPTRADGRAYELKEFQNLPSLPRRSAQKPNTEKYDDAIFWAIKLEAIAQIRATGWCDHDRLKDWAFDLFVTKAKDRSTLKAKVRNVWQWYQDRDWKIDDRSFTMSRTEGAKKATAIRQERTKAKIQGAINVLRLYGAKITAEAVAKEAKIARGTAQKYLKELKEQGAI